MISSLIKLLLLTLCIAVVNSTLEFMDFKPYIQARESVGNHLESAMDGNPHDETEQAGEGKAKKETDPRPLAQPINPADW